MLDLQTSFADPSIMIMSSRSFVKPFDGMVGFAEIPRHDKNRGSSRGGVNCPVEGRL